MRFPDYFRRLYDVTADKDNAARLIGMLISADIPFGTVNESDGKITFRVRHSDLKKTGEIFTVLNAEYTAVPFGFHAHIIRHRRRAGILAGALVFTVACIVSSQYIWDVDIPYSEEIPQQELEALLSDAGLYIGAKKSNIDEIKAASEVILKNDSISWLSINLKGTVAHVEYRTTQTAQVVDTSSPSNLISRYDGQIVTMALDGGMPAVKCGQIVKKGQLLVSGVIDSEAFGCRLVRSRGSVKASVEQRFSISVPLKTEVKTVFERMTSCVSIKIFKKNLKLFASIDNLPEKYDTIEVNNRLTVFGIRLPISICTDYAVPYTVRYITLTDDEAYAVAQSKLYEQIYDTLGDAEIISTSEDVTSDGNVLTLTAVVDCVCEIADEVKINTVK